MKNLDLNNYNLVEMNEVEMKETDGGNWLTKGIKNLAKAIYIGVSDAYNGFLDGFHDGQTEKH